MKMSGLLVTAIAYSALVWITCGVSHLTNGMCTVCCVVCLRRSRLGGKDKAVASHANTSSLMAAARCEAHGSRFQSWPEPVARQFGRAIHGRG